MSESERIAALVKQAERAGRKNRGVAFLFVCWHVLDDDEKKAEVERAVLATMEAER